MRFYGEIKAVFGHVDLLPSSAEAEVEVWLCDTHHQVLRTTDSPTVRTP